MQWMRRLLFDGVEAMGAAAVVHEQVSMRLEDVRRANGAAKRLVRRPHGGLTLELEKLSH